MGSTRIRMALDWAGPNPPLSLSSRLKSSRARDSLSTARCFPIPWTFRTGGATHRIARGSADPLVGGCRSEKRRCVHRLIHNRRGVGTRRPLVRDEDGGDRPTGGDLFRRGIPQVSRQVPVSSMPRASRMRPKGSVGRSFGNLGGVRQGFPSWWKVFRSSSRGRRLPPIQEPRQGETPYRVWEERSE